MPRVISHTARLAPRRFYSGRVGLAEPGLKRHTGIKWIRSESVLKQITIFVGM